ncbi:JAB domain-containing protein [Sorangium sp. So ce1078]|uniref:JAB domain-containing protein n=1 Tax=Sorangium sp. So ce1078 TaxID=3133329 RepID=UPI003F5FE0CF
MSALPHARSRRGGSRSHEELWIAALDTHGRLRETRLLARGSDDALYVGRSTLLRTALDMAAHSFVLVHDHPSGDPTPTREDEAMTLELRHLASDHRR